MKRITFSFLALFMISGATFAQVKVHVGGSTTVHGTFILDEGLRTNPQYVGVQEITMAPVGLNFGLDFSNKFGLQLESIVAHYRKAYEMYETVSNTKIGELQFDMQYLNIPMLMKFMSGSDNRTRFNFMMGPQLSMLTSGQQSLTLFQQAAGQNIAIPDIGEYSAGDATLPEGTQQQEDGSFTFPQTIPGGTFQSNLLASDAEEKIRKFREQEIHIVAGFGLDIDLTKNLYMSALIKADYGLSDMRNGDLIDDLKANGRSAVEGLFSRRANLAVGAQITFNYMFGGTRFFLKAL